MTVKAKAVVQAFYGVAARLSYWNGCSTGGRQGLKEAQMFPNDFDGIIAGAPANRTAISLWIADAVLKDPATMRDALGGFTSPIPVRIVPSRRSRSRDKI